jgi:hypothetical protein
MFPGTRGLAPSRATPSNRTLKETRRAGSIGFSLYPMRSNNFGRKTNQERLLPRRCFQRLVTKSEVAVIHARNARQVIENKGMKG